MDQESQRRSASATRSGISGDPEPLLIKIGPLSTNNDNTVGGDDSASIQPASINTTMKQPPVAIASTNTAKIEIEPGKKTRQIAAEDKEVSTTNRHHFSLTRNHNGHVPGKAMDHFTILIICWSLDM